MEHLRIHILVFLVLLMGCDLPFDPGPMPTDIIATSYEPAMNILGVIRLDGSSGNSYVYVQRTMTTEEIYSFDIDPTVTDALVQVVESHGAVENTFDFSHSADSNARGLYRDSLFLPQAGNTYALTISASEFPTISASTIVPALPTIDSASLSVENQAITFTLQQRSDAYQYNLYLVFAAEVLERELSGAESLDRVINWSWDESLGQPLELTIAASDENLTVYGSTSTALLPNTYHDHGSTVAGGFGCFGSVAVNTYTLQ
jgi:hypothetical protein